LIDIFKPEAKDWFWNIYKDLQKQGVAGWWGDLGEPEIHPADLQHVNGSADQVHNLYGHEWARMIHDGYRKDFPGQRPFILMRAGAAGSQRYGLIPWSGDVNRTWGGLQSQTEIALQMGMQGLAYMHSDLGGFAGPNLDDELYARWLQYGVFQPIFRPHAQEEVASEPVYREARARDLAREAIRLRYRLLPYNYTLGFDNSRSGLPLMRPLMYEEPDNPQLLNVADTYLWGHEFLVTPVTAPGLQSKEIYFPANHVWFDFYSGQAHAGGSKETVALVPEHIPVFVRAGAFIPMTEVVRSTDDYSTRHVDLHYYHDRSVAAGSGKLYDDDGVTPSAFEQGKYELVHMNSTLQGDLLTLTLNSERGEQRKAVKRGWSVSVHNVAARPRAVRANNAVLPFTWDADGKVLRFDLPSSTRKASNIAIALAAGAKQ
jgi:alpha-glucosidase (family GH31 glycosyl hydrolase)